MKLGSIKETQDKRVAITPDSVKTFHKLGVSVQLETGYGDHLYTLAEYRDAGANFESQDSILKSDMLLQVFTPVPEIIKKIAKKTMLVALLNPFHEQKQIQAIASEQLTSFAMELIPRSTRAQKMDVLSSQASLAGYAAVILASQRCDKVLPMMMTPAGTLSPSKVFIIGAGVAGLQAIATAKRLGAKVEAFDTRADVEEQVHSLGAKFLKVDLGQTGQTKDGYATQLTQAQLNTQRDMMKKACEQADIVITTAQVFGRKAPIIVTKPMVNSMKKGSIIVDLAVDTGGNVDGIKAGEEIDLNGVHLIGLTQLPQQIAKHASQMLSANYGHFVSEFYNEESKMFEINNDDDIIQSALVTQAGNIMQDRLIQAYKQKDR